MAPNRLMSTVKSFSLPDEAVLILEHIPKNERSEFVTNAIFEAARQETRLQAIEAIKNFPRYRRDDLPSVIETLRNIRKEAD